MQHLARTHTKYAPVIVDAKASLVNPIDQIVLQHVFQSQQVTRLHQLVDYSWLAVAILYL